MSNIILLVNGRCARTCALFTTAIRKHGVRTLVAGGKAGQPQQYCGTVGGASTSHKVINHILKATGLKNNLAAPPHFISDSYQGAVLQLALEWEGAKVEEWIDHETDLTMDLTLEIVNKSESIRKAVAKQVWNLDVA
ncbi:hypothetical protein BT69DRAFT_1243113 [Atractiella rhizophila]|nr:hypothetical protein BT69DRAFT_1243113 [Atractiella rhizophila]